MFAERRIPYGICELIIVVLDVVTLSTVIIAMIVFTYLGKAHIAHCYLIML